MKLSYYLGGSIAVGLVQTGRVSCDLGPRREWNREFVVPLIPLFAEALPEVESVGEGVTNVEPVRHRLLPSWGLYSDHKGKIVARVIMSSLSTPLNAESVSSARAIKPTFASRACISLLRFDGLWADAFSQVRATQGQGLMPNKTSRFTAWGQPIYHYVRCYPCTSNHQSR